MTDDGAEPLHTEFLEHLPDCTPRDLTYIQWGGSKSSERGPILYKVARISNADGGEKINATECDCKSIIDGELDVGQLVLRQTGTSGEDESWTADSILVH